MTTYKRRFFSIIAILFIFDLFVWQQIIFGGPKKETAIYALNVGQGDSELLVLPHGIKVLIDGGPTNKVLSELNSTLGSFDRYIDLVVLSHPETDHFSGLIDVFKRYKVGALISSGKEGKAKSYLDFKKAVLENGSSRINLAEGDRIILGDASFEILWPSKEIVEGASANESALVLKLETLGAKALFTGDIGAETEVDLLKNHNLNVDILKVAHHGSKFSSAEEFLKAVTPKISFIEVGAKNSYGHPTAEVLENLKEIGSKIFRTDLNGRIKLVIASSSVKILKEK